MDARLSALALGVALMAGTPTADPRPEADSLVAVEAAVARRYPGVEQLDPAALDALRAQPGAAAFLLDVREPAEYAVSRLQGAIRIDPDADLEALLRTTGPLPAGARLVFYCSVGVRSTRLAERLRHALRAHGVAQIANLRGGVFAWHNARRPLHNEQGPTDAVHGYDARWSQLLTRGGARTEQPD